MADHSAFVGNIPHWYDHGLGPNIFDHFGRVTAERVAALKPGSVLELAAGTGFVTRHLRDSLDDGVALTATDLNDGMLEVARGKFAAGEKVTFAIADAQDLPFGRNSFDVLVCQFGHMFFPDRARAHAEAQRVLKRGGTYLFTTWGPAEENPFSKIVDEHLQELFPDEPPGFYAVPFSMPDPEPVLAELEAAGLRGARHERMHHVVHVRDHRNFANGLVFGNPSIEEIRAVTSDVDAVRDKLAHRLEQSLGKAPAPMPLVANVFECTLQDTR